MSWFIWAKSAAERSSFYRGLGSGEALVFGIVDLFVALCLITGGAGLLGRQHWGRLALYAGAGIDALFSSYMVVRFFTEERGGSPLSILFPVLDIVIIVCLSLPPTAHYLSTRNPVVPMRRW